MKEFVSSALPWVMAGIAMAILAANHSPETQKDHDRGTRLAAGTSFGLLLGAGLNGCGLWGNHLFGLALGPLWGMALASLFKTPTEKEG